MTRVPRLGVAILGIAWTGLLSGEALQITTTPSHTPTHTPTPTPTATGGPSTSPTPRPTPWLSGSAEIPVSTFTSGEQRASSIANTADGGFVVAWAGYAQDGDSGGIFAQRYDATGDALGPEIQVNSTTTGNQYSPSVDADFSGDFVVVWTGPDAAGQTDVFARRFGSDGAPLGGEIPVNSYATGFQSGARVSKETDGFLAVWSSAPGFGQPGQDGDGGGIYGRRFDDEGNPVGDEFLVNQTTTGDQSGAAVSGDGFGSTVVIWESADGPPGSGAGIFGRRIESGVPAGSEFQVNTYTPGHQYDPDVAGWPNHFVVVWTSQAQDGSGAGVFGRAFEHTNLELPTFQVNTHTALGQTRARVGMDPYLGFLVVWQSFGQDDPGTPPSAGVFAQRYANAPFFTGQFALVQPRRGVEYQINVQTSGGQALPDVTDGIAGRFVVSWDSPVGNGPLSGVYARRFSYPAADSLAVDETPSAGTSNLNSILEPGEQVRVAPTWSNNAGPDVLQLTASATAIQGPPGPTYLIEDSAADYGPVAPGATTNCETATGDCYEISVAGARPATHWDATFDELTSVPSITLPVTKTWALHVGDSFADVPHDGFYPFIENILHNGITSGGGCGPGLFCGEEGVMRQQMAVFLVKGARGPGFAPPPATGAMFDDVSAANPFAPWIEELARMEITAGCTAPPPPALPSYCPTAVVSRQQMAVFLVKSLFGFSLFGCSPTFEDMPCPNPFQPYAYAIYEWGITAGCQTNPLRFCPMDPTKRKQMAAFLVKTFGLELYGPD